MKIKSLLLISMLLLSLVFLCSFEQTDDFFSYETDENGNVTIIAFTGEMFSENVTIPASIKGKPVTRIADSAFYNHPYIQSVTIPSSVTVIERAAFGYCDELSSVVFEDGSSQIMIGEGAFENCQMLTNLDFGSRPVYIDDMAFENCIRLGNVDIGNNIVHFGYRAFSGCESLIFDIDNNPLAEQHAKEYFIPTSFFSTDRFLIIVSLSSALVILGIIFTVYFIKKRRAK